MASPLPRVALLSLLLAASGVTLAAGAPTAAAECTFDFGSCEGGSCVVNAGECYQGSCTVNVDLCYQAGCTVNAWGCWGGGQCTVNTAFCQAGGRCTVNTDVCSDGASCAVVVTMNLQYPYSFPCNGGGDCVVTAGACLGGHCAVNLDICRTDCAGCAGDCDVNAGWCWGACPANAGGCEPGGTCEVNAGSCYGSCAVNAGDCGPSGRCFVNVGGDWQHPCSEACTVEVDTACRLRAEQVVASLYGPASAAANDTSARASALLAPIYKGASDSANSTLGILSGALAPYLALALDPDQDGYATTSEISSSSDPASAASTPESDDDGDGIPNRQEQSRAHALGVVTQPAVRAAASDFVWLHMGVAGATASLTSPTGATMRVAYTPSPGPGCPLPLTRPAPDIVHDCALPVVVKVGFNGQVLAARAAYEPSVAVPASAFRVVCAPAPLAPTAPGPCLVGAGADGTWLLAPAQQSPRVSTQVKAPGGMVVSLQGKVFDDVSPDSGDMASGGSGQNSRDATMAFRLWNWHEQAPGTTYQACSGGLVAPCLTEGPAEEHVSYASFLVAS